MIIMLKAIVMDNVANKFKIPILVGPNRRRQTRKQSTK